MSHMALTKNCRHCLQKLASIKLQAVPAELGWIRTDDTSGRIHQS